MLINHISHALFNSVCITDVLTEMSSGDDPSLGFYSEQINICLRIIQVNFHHRMKHHRYYNHPML